MRCLAVMALLALLLVPLASGSLHAQAVRGLVRDAASGAPLPDVEIRLVSSSGVAVADATTRADGSFLAYVRTAGWHRLYASRIGYEALAGDSIFIGTREVVAIELRLAARAVPLDAITVTARLPDPRHDLSYEGLYARRAQLPPIGPRRATSAGASSSGKRSAGHSACEARKR